jgi:hypothetical protein
MEEKKTIWNSAFLIFILPALCVIFSYCYESGYASFFGIPQTLVAISNYSILDMLLPAALLFMTIYSFDSILSYIKDRMLKDVKEEYIKTRIARNFFYLFYISTFFCVFIVIFRNNLVVISMYGILVVFYTLRLILIGNELRKKKKGIIPWERERKYEITSTTFHIERIIGTKAWLALMMIVFSSGIVYGIGSYMAQSQSSYFYINGDSNLVIFKKMGASYIGQEKSEYISKNKMKFVIVPEAKVESIIVINKDGINYT